VVPTDKPHLLAPADGRPNERIRRGASVALSDDDASEHSAPLVQPSRWPALRFEERPWTIPDSSSRSERRRLSDRYQAAVVSPIAGIERVPLPSEVEGLVADASAEIARFDAEVGADIAPFSSILLRSESAASSRIENLTASAKAIALAELGDLSRRNAAVIVANSRAMQAALQLADHLDEDAILAMHSALLASTHPEWCGHWRTEQVWVGGSNWGPFEAQYVAPHHDRVPAAMADLVSFLDRDDMAPLTQAAVAHAQFETIHPFPDGNGRVGRALIHALLKGKGLTRQVTVPVSAGLLVETESYFRSLDAYRQGDPAPLVRRLADASYAAISNGRQLIGDLHTARAKWDDRIKARRDAAAWQLADLLLRQPIVDSRLLQQEWSAPARTAERAIDTLAEAGVLTKVSGNFRDRKWAANDVFRALDDFASRAGRRGSPAPGYAAHRPTELRRGTAASPSPARGVDVVG
jgi:Fic family protein